MPGSLLGISMGSSVMVLKEPPSSLYLLITATTSAGSYSTESLMPVYWLGSPGPRKVLLMRTNCVSAV
jgi:hypothetical protein